MPFTEIWQEEESRGCHSLRYGRKKKVMEENANSILDTEFKVLMEHPSKDIQDMITYC